MSELHTRALETDYKLKQHLNAAEELQSELEEALAHEDDPAKIAELNKQKEGLKRSINQNRYPE